MTAFSPSLPLTTPVNAYVDFPLAFYLKLKSSITYDVYDHIPQTDPYTLPPYVVVGDDNFTEWETDGKAGFNILATVHSWSEYRGGKEINEITSAIYLALHREELNVSGYNCLGITQESLQNVRDPDGITRHGVQQFRIFLIEV